MDGTAVPGSLPEGAAERSEAEGVSFVGCFGPTVYTPTHINSEIFKRLRSSGDTPSVTPFGRASSLREGAGMGAYHSMYRPENGRGRAIFIAPTKLRGGYLLPFNRVLAKPEGGGGFSSPRRAFTVHWRAGVLPRVNWYFIISVWRSWCMTPSAILRMSRDATKAMVFSASSLGTL